jgi:hypothetical protein
VKKIRARLSKIGHSLALTNVALAGARRRYKKQHERSERLRRQARAAERLADQLRHEGKPKRAAAEDATAAQLEARATAAKAASRVTLGQVKRLNQKSKGLAQTRQQLEDRLHQIIASSRPKVDGNNVTGGTPEQRMQTALLTAAARCAHGERPNRYSQLGTFSARYCITGEPYGYRTDCSQFGISAFHSIGAPDPVHSNWTAGWTGSIVQLGEEVSRDYARNHAGVAVVFGDGPGHHVEWSIGDGTEHTIGHGSAPVDMGTFDLLPGTVRFFKFPLA